jgi:hypothetical protein
MPPCSGHVQRSSTTGGGEDTACYDQAQSGHVAMHVFSNGLFTPDEQLDLTVKGDDGDEREWCDW